MRAAPESMANANPRPFAVTGFAYLYLAVGVITSVSHFAEYRANRGAASPEQELRDIVMIELTEFIAIISGAFMLRGHNWARWVAVAWIAAHTIASAFNGWGAFAFHAVICAAIAWGLFRSDATRYFRGARVEQAG